MEKNIFELAAMASAAVANLNITGVSTLDDSQGNSALVIDDQGKKWRVRLTETLNHSSKLDHELHNLKIFTPAIRAGLPFSATRILGHFRQNDTKIYVYSSLDGVPFDTSMLEGKSLTERAVNYAKSMGHCLAALHNIPMESLEANSLPYYFSAEFRNRKLKELDQAAATGKIPARLLSRWENILEDVSLWRFAPTVVHGDLNENNILIGDTDITAFTGWTNLHGGDPAEDFMWLTTLSSDDFKTTVLQSYEAHTERAHNPHLLKRAGFHAEFALAQWLIEGFVTADAAKVVEAEGMLKALDNGIKLSEQPEAAADHEKDPTRPATVAEKTILTAV